MTKKQRECIKYQLDSYLRKSDRMEEKSEKAELECNLEKVKRCLYKADIFSGQIESAIRVLETLGYSVRYDIDSDSYLILDN